MKLLLVAGTMCASFVAFVATLVPARLVPQLATIALTDQHSAPLEQRELAQLRRQQQSSMSVEVQFGGVTHHEPLQSTRLRV